MTSRSIVPATIPVVGPKKETDIFDTDPGGPPPTYKPRQSHCLVETTWTPPKNEPFVSYESVVIPPGGEIPWPAWCGLGELFEVLIPLFDVRDERDNLMGYVQLDPTTAATYEILVPPSMNFGRFVARPTSPGNPGEFIKPSLNIVLTVHYDLGQCWWAGSRNDKKTLDHVGALVPPMGGLEWYEKNRKFSGLIRRRIGRPELACMKRLPKRLR